MIFTTLLKNCFRTLRTLKQRYRLSRTCLKNRHRYEFTLSEAEKIDTLVVSAGGVATTMLIQHFANYISVNGGNDPKLREICKHLPFAPKFPEGSRVPNVLFITGDPDVSYKSLARRGWVQAQSSKLGSLGAIWLPGRFQKYFFVKAVRRQRRAWEEAAELNVWFLDYEQLWNNIDRIVKFTNSPPAAAENFPRKKQRSSA